MFFIWVSQWVTGHHADTCQYFSPLHPASISSSVLGTLVTTPHCDYIVTLAIDTWLTHKINSVCQGLWNTPPDTIRIAPLEEYFTILLLSSEILTDPSNSTCLRLIIHGSGDNFLGFCWVSRSHEMVGAELVFMDFACIADVWQRCEKWKYCTHTHSFVTRHTPTGCA